MMNDVCDRDIDAVHPARPAPRGVLEPHSVLAESLLIYLLAPAPSLAVGLAAFRYGRERVPLSVAHYGFTKQRSGVPGSSELITSAVLRSSPLAALQWQETTISRR
jgi:hypothetical protein